MIYQIEKSLKELGDKVPSNDRSQIEEQIENLRGLLTSDDAQAIRSAIEGLQNASHALAQQMYAQEGDNGQNPYGGTPDDEDIIDAEYA
jgi:molecular chaperone DnaK